MAQARLTIEQIENALKAKAGNISEAAKALGVSRSTFYRRIEESPRLQEYLEDQREALVDIAESALRAEVVARNITAIIFALKTQGKRRGYVERTENVNFNVPSELIQRAIEAIEQQGLNASDVFNNIIAASAEDSRVELSADGDSTVESAE